MANLEEKKTHVVQEWELDSNGGIVFCLKPRTEKVVNKYNVDDESYLKEICNLIYTHPSIGKDVIMSATVGDDTPTTFIINIMVFNCNGSALTKDDIPTLLSSLDARLKCHRVNVEFIEKISPA